MECFNFNANVSDLKSIHNERRNKYFSYIFYEYRKNNNKFNLTRKKVRNKNNYLERK